MSIKQLKDVGFVLTVPTKDAYFIQREFIVDIYFENIDQDSTTKQLNDFTYLICSKNITQKDVEKFLAFLPTLISSAEIKNQQEKKKEEEHATKLLAKMHTITPDKKFKGLTSYINQLVIDACEEYKAKYYKAVADIFHDYQYVMNVYNMIKIGHFAEVYPLILGDEVFVDNLSKEIKLKIKKEYQKKYQ